MDAKQFIQVMNMDYLKKEKEPMKQFDYAMVKDPEYFRDGRLDAHSDHVYYASEEEAVDRETSYRESLNGLWKFQYARNYESAIPGFEAEEYNCKDWEDIYVPAHIQMEGYDVPQYANVQYPWEGHEEINPGEIPTHFNPTASYVNIYCSGADAGKTFVYFLPGCRERTGSVAEWKVCWIQRRLFYTI